jgi:protein-tyrosine phosphatase
MCERHLLLAILALGLMACEIDDATVVVPSPDAGEPQDAARPQDATLPDATSPPDGCSPGHFVLIGQASNVRDLGGTPLAGGTSIACGPLYRGSALAGLTDEGCTGFTQLGVRTVIDLRVDSERAAKPDPACVTDQSDLVLAPMPIPYALSPGDYVADLAATESVTAAFAVLGDPAAYPVYFHCVYGRDRTGVLAAVILLALGATRQDVLAEYALTAEAGLTIYPASLEAVLDTIDDLGGIDAYLDSAGIPGAAVDVLAAQAVAP